MRSHTSDKFLSVFIPVLVLLAPFSQMRLPHLPLSLFDVGVVLVAGFLFIFYPITELCKSVRALSPFLWGLVAVYAVASVGRRPLAGNLKEVAQMVEYFIVFPLIISHYLAGSRNEIRTLIRALLISGAMITAIAVYEIYALGAPYASAAFASRSNLGLFFSVLIPIGFELAAQRGLRGALPKILVACAFSTVLSSCWIGIAVAVLWVSLHEIRRYAPTLILIVLVQIGTNIVSGLSPIAALKDDLALYEIVDGNREVRQRYIEAQAALNLMGDNFLLGVGPANYQLNIGSFYHFYPKSNTIERDTQSGYLVLGTTTGFLGLLMLCAIYASLLAPEPRLKRDSPLYSTHMGIRAAGVALAVNTLFAFPLIRGIAPLLAMIFTISERQKAVPQYFPATEESTLFNLSEKAWLTVQICVLGFGFIILAPHLYKGAAQPTDTIRFKATDYIKIEPPMIVSREGNDLLLEIPMNSGKGWYNGTGGEAVYLVSIEKAAKYTLWADAWWTDGCTNCFNVSLNKRAEKRSKPFILGNDALYQTWHWVRGSQYDLAPGLYDLTFFNREDGVKLREIALTTDQDFDRTQMNTAPQTVTFPGSFNERTVKHLSNNEWMVVKPGAHAVLSPRAGGAVLRLSDQRWNDFELSCEATLKSDCLLSISISPQGEEPQVRFEIAENHLAMHGGKDNSAAQLQTVEFNAAPEIHLVLKRLRETISGSINGKAFRFTSANFPGGEIAVSASSESAVLISQLTLRHVESFFDGFAGCDKNIAGDWQMVAGDWKIVEASLSGTSGVDDAILQVAKGKAFAEVGRTWWSNYDVSLRCFPTSPNGWGVGFYEKDQSNFYLLRTARPDGALPYAGSLQLVKVTGGKETVLASAKWDYDLDQWYKAAIECAHGRIVACIDNKEMLSATDDTLKEGKVFLFTEDNPGVYFDNILVEFLQ
jgi:hypothetical protein